MKDLIVLREFGTRAEAEIVEELLRAGGIDVRLNSDDCGAVDPALSFARGVQILVPSGQYEPAEDILARAEAQPGDDEDETMGDEEPESAMASDAVRPVPAGFHTLTPYLVVRDASRLLAFLEAAFDARVIEVHRDPAGRIVNAELQVGDSRLMMGEAQEEQAVMPACLLVYVEDADAWFERAVAAGAEVVRDIADQFYGDRSGGVRDPAGNQWWLSTRIENLSPGEIARRAAAQGRG